MPRRSWSFSTCSSTILTALRRLINAQQGPASWAAGGCDAQYRPGYPGPYCVPGQFLGSYHIWQLFLLLRPIFL